MKQCIYKSVNPKCAGIILEEFLSFRNVNWCYWSKQRTYTNTYFKTIKIKMLTYFVCFWVSNVPTKSSGLWSFFLLFIKPQEMMNIMTSIKYCIFLVIFSVWQSPQLFCTMNETAFSRLFQRLFDRYESRDHIVYCLFSHCNIGSKTIMISLSAFITTLLI